MKHVHVASAQRHMATTFDLVISCPEGRALAARQVLAEAHARIARLEAELSEFLESSPIARLNAAPPFERIALPPSAIELLDRSERVRLVSDGAFDCCVKSEVPGHPQVEWSRESLVAWRVLPGARVSFAAIGKGYALDRVREDLEREGFHDYCLTAGGSSILLSGFSAPDVPWLWGWSWEKAEDGTPRGIPFRHLSGIPVALGVSGLHEQGAHLKDPRTGLAVTKWKSALIGHVAATEADALSTALFVSGWDKALPLFGQLADKPAMAVIDREGVPRWNGFFEALWGKPATLMLLCLAFFFNVAAFAEDAVDLSSMGMDDFTPYMFDRNRLWILLPLLSLVLVFVHLKQRPKPKRATKKKSLESVT